MDAAAFLEEQARDMPSPVPNPQRQARAVSLRTAGASYPQVAQEVGYADRHEARDAVVRALRANPVGDAVEEMRDVEGARLDLIQQNMTAIMIDRTMPPAERIRAANTLITNSARRSRLMGLDAPLRVEVTPDLRMEAVAALEGLRQIVAGTVVSSTDDDAEADDGQSAATG
jgi:hypothetical protein